MLQPEDTQSSGDEFEQTPSPNSTKKPVQNSPGRKSAHHAPGMKSGHSPSGKKNDHSTFRNITDHADETIVTSKTDQNISGYINCHFTLGSKPSQMSSEPENKTPARKIGIGSSKLGKIISNEKNTPERHTGRNYSSQLLCTLCKIAFPTQHYSVKHRDEVHPGTQNTPLFIKIYVDVRKEVVKVDGINNKIQPNKTSPKIRTPKFKFPQKFSCFRCKRTFFDQNMAKKHLKYCCNVTPKSVNQRTKVQGNISQRKSHGYMCVLCKEVFTTYYSRRKHRLDMHPNLASKKIFNKVNFSNNARVVINPTAIGESITETLRKEADVSRKRKSNGVSNISAKRRMSLNTPQNLDQADEATAQSNQPTIAIPTVRAAKIRLEGRRWSSAQTIIEFSDKSILRHSRVHHKELNLTADDNKIVGSNTSHGQFPLKDNIIIINSHRHAKLTSSYKNPNTTTVQKTKVEGLGKRQTKKIEKMKKIYKCTKCDMYFINAKTWRFHRMNHTHKPKSNSRCTSCGLTFSKKSLVYHKKVHHKELKLSREDFIIITETEKEESQKQTDAQIPAQDNDKENTERSLIKSTPQVSNEARPNVTQASPTTANITLFKCNECNVYFMDESECSQHACDHTPFEYFDYVKCPDCELQFDSDKLKSHRKKHHVGDFNLEDVVVKEYKPYEGIMNKPKIVTYNAKEKEEPTAEKAQNEINVILPKVITTRTDNISNGSENVTDPSLEEYFFNSRQLHITSNNKKKVHIIDNKLISKKVNEDQNVMVQPGVNTSNQETNNHKVDKYLVDKRQEIPKEKTIAENHTQQTVETVKENLNDDRTIGVATREIEDEDTLCWWDGQAEIIPDATEVANSHDDKERSGSTEIHQELIHCEEYETNLAKGGSPSTKTFQINFVSHNKDNDEHEETNKVEESEYETDNDDEENEVQIKKGNSNDKEKIELGANIERNPETINKVTSENTSEKESPFSKRRSVSLNTEINILDEENEESVTELHIFVNTIKHENSSNVPDPMNRNTSEENTAERQVEKTRYSKEVTDKRSTSVLKIVPGHLRQDAAARNPNENNSDNTKINQSSFVKDTIQDQTPDNNNRIHGKYNTLLTNEQIEPHRNNGVSSSISNEPIESTQDILDNSEIEPSSMEVAPGTYQSDIEDNDSADEEEMPETSHIMGMEVDADDRTSSAPLESHHETVVVIAQVHYNTLNYDHEINDAPRDNTEQIIEKQHEIESGLQTNCKQEEKMKALEKIVKELKFRNYKEIGDEIHSNESRAKIKKIPVCLENNKTDKNDVCAQNLNEASLQIDITIMNKTAEESNNIIVQREESNQFADNDIHDTTPSSGAVLEDNIQNISQNNLDNSPNGISEKVQSLVINTETDNNDSQVSYENLCKEKMTPNNVTKSSSSRRILEETEVENNEKDDKDAQNEDKTQRVEFNVIEEPIRSSIRNEDKTQRVEFNLTEEPINSTARNEDKTQRVEVNLTEESIKSTEQQYNDKNEKNVVDSNKVIEVNENEIENPEGIKIESNIIQNELFEVVEDGIEITGDESDDDVICTGFIDNYISLVGNANDLSNTKTSEEQNVILDSDDEDKVVIKTEKHEQTDIRNYLQPRATKKQTGTKVATIEVDDFEKRVEELEENLQNEKVAEQTVCPRKHTVYIHLDSDSNDEVTAVEKGASTDNRSDCTKDKTIVVLDSDED